MFEWDRNNLRKIRAHRIKRREAEQALLNDPIEQDVEDELRYVYHGETNSGRLFCRDVRGADRRRGLSCHDTDQFAAFRNHDGQRAQGE